MNGGWSSGVWRMGPGSLASGPENVQDTFTGILS